MKELNVFLDSKQLATTNNAYALASSAPHDGFDEQYVNLDTLINEVQMMCNNAAMDMVKAQEAADGVPVDLVEVRASWRAYMFILENLKGRKVMV